MTTNKNIISLTGISGVGKSTIASILQEEKGYKVVSWCSELRRRVALKCDLLNIPEQYTSSYRNEIVPDKKWEHESGFHQLLLEEPIETKLRAFTFTCHVILELAREDEKIVIPDTRFPREYEFFCDLGARKVFVSSTAFSSDRKVQPFDLLLEQYPFDIFIKNNGTREELKTNLEAYF
jgi:hypothetical protein